MHADLLSAITALVVAVNGLLALITNGRLHHLKRQVNGTLDNLIALHRSEAYKAGYDAAKREGDPHQCASDSKSSSELSSSPSAAGMTPS